jgi:NSS family neurotransmitter:Na+ symporter
MDFFTLIDWVAVKISLPIGELLIALYAAYKWGFARFQADTNVGAGRITVQNAWKPFRMVVIPVAVAIVTIAGLFG